MKLIFTLRFKLMVLFCLLIMTPFIITGAITFRHYMESSESKARDYYTQLTSQISTNFDNYSNDIYKLLMVYFSDKTVIETTNKHSGTSNNYPFIFSSEASSLYSILSTIVYDRPEIKGIFVFCNDGAVFSNTSRNGEFNKQLSDHWISYRPENDDNMLLIPPHEVNYYNAGKENVFSLMRTVRSSYDGQFVGMIKVDIKPEAFEQMVFSNDSASGTGTSIIITDNQENVYYPTNLWGKKYSDIEINSKENEDEYLKITHTSDHTGVKIVGLFRRSELVKDAKSLAGYIALISVISLMAAMVIAIIASNRLISPIRHLMQKMNQVCEGKLWIKADIKTRDELGLLSNGFNTMVEKIRNLIYEVGILSREMYEIKIRKRDAELSALQSQLNPHFLYNTLELLNMMALENNQFDICIVSTNLGRLLRYTVSKDQKLVCLKEEIKFVDSYLKIYSIRLGDRLETKISVDSALLDCLVPKLIIQPLVENSIKHGLCEDKGRLSVNAEVSNGAIIIQVSDDGIGMNEQKLEKVKKRIYEEDSKSLSEEFEQKSSGYALRNVHRRIKLLYGEEYGLIITSFLNKGTTFSIKIPIVSRETLLVDKEIQAYGKNL